MWTCVANREESAIDVEHANLSPIGPDYLTSAGRQVFGRADVEADHVRIVTAYRPHANEWEPDLKTRRSQT